jgi:hypothetical protein
MAVTMQRGQAENLPPNTQMEGESTRPTAETVPPITSNPARLGGTPVIGIERLPVEYLNAFARRWLKGGWLNR